MLTKPIGTGLVNMALRAGMADGTTCGLRLAAGAIPLLPGRFGPDAWVISFTVRYLLISRMYDVWQSGRER